MLARDWLHHLDIFVNHTLATYGVPGLALSLFNKQETLFQKAYGFANLEAQTPLRTDYLFQIASISKSMTALLVLQEVDKGRLELHTPVKTYLPFFESPHADSITLHHLLTHTSGLNCGLNAVPFTSRYEVLYQKAASSRPPGETFHYSNLGYIMLGWILERVTGRSLPTLRRERILEPLGMKDSTSEIRHAYRTRYPTAYMEFYGDRPHHASYGLVPAPFFEFVNGDGSVCATPEDLSKYARLFLNQGCYQTNQGVQRTVSEKSWQLMTTPWIALDDKATSETRFEGYGIECFELNGSRCLGHNGECHGFTTELLVDTDEGLGVVLFINSTGVVDLAEIAEHLLRSLQAMRRGETVPDFPSFWPHLQNASDYAGVYTSDKDVLEFVVKNNQLSLSWNSQEIRLEPFGSESSGPDTFLITHPDLNHSAFIFQRNEAGQVSEVIHGGVWRFNQHYQGERACNVSDILRSYVGRYQSFSPWSPEFRIHVIKDKLWLESYPPASFGSGFLEARADGSFLLPDSFDSLFFDTVIEGCAMRARMSNYFDFYRSEAL
jgi:CubicO group peptidase (beta-lactamase class C family)